MVEVVQNTEHKEMHAKSNTFVAQLWHRDRSTFWIPTLFTTFHCTLEAPYLYLKMLTERNFVA